MSKYSTSFLVYNIDMYDLIFIGAGPATIGSVLELIDKNYKGTILIIEKGKSLKYRLPNEVISGWAGAGAFSDCKLSSSLSVGGSIPNLTEEKLEIYEQKLLDKFNKFTLIPLKWDETTDFDTSPSNLKWDKHKTLHVGSDRGREIFLDMENFIESQPNIDIMFESEVLDVDKINGNWVVKINSCNMNVLTISAFKVIIATGQKNTLPSRLIEKYHLLTTPRAIQLGVRVVDEINSDYEKIIKANYDFKFTQEKDWGDGVKTKVRTFCCNSGNAHVCEEKNSEGFSCFNGHAFKQPDPNNHSVNYGIICELEDPGMDLFIGKLDSKEKQIELMKKINNKFTWQVDNFNGDKVSPLRYLLDGFNHLTGYYPSYILIALEEFVKELSKIIDLSQAKYLYPEVKLNDGKMIKCNNYESSEKGLYFIGDCYSTRGILKAFSQGIELSNFLIEEEMDKCF